MKISLALGPRRSLSRQTAWGCFTANVAMPGSGSLAAGRISGYPQVILCFAGVLLTTVFGLRAIVWYLSNWSRFQSSEADPMAVLAEMWLVLRWALLGMGVFALSWIWALLTSLRILSAADPLPPKVPPKLT